MNQQKKRIRRTNTKKNITINSVQMLKSPRTSVIYFIRLGRFKGVAAIREAKRRKRTGE